LLPAHACVLCAKVLLGINFAVSYCWRRVRDASYRTFSAAAMVSAIPDGRAHLSSCDLRPEDGCRTPAHSIARSIDLPISLSDGECRTWRIG
jgi:hypothetical protein